MNDRDRCAPIALSADTPIAHAIINVRSRFTKSSEMCDDRFASFSGRKSVKGSRIHKYAFIVRTHFIGSFVINDTYDRQLELLSELIVTFIVRRNRHHRAGSIPSEHVIGDPDRYLLST